MSFGLTVSEIKLHGRDVSRNEILDVSVCGLVLYFGNRLDMGLVI